METDAASLGEAAEQAEAQVAALRAELESVESDRKDLSRALAEVEAELGRVQEQARQASEGAAAATARVAELEGELESVESDRKDLSRSLADVESELGRVQAQVAQQEEAEEELEVEELDAERRAQEAEAQVERLKQRVTMLEGALGTSRGKSLEVDAEAHQALEARLAEVEAELAEERERRAALEAAAPAAEQGGASDEVVAERDQLREDVAAMKRKLMAAETALETAASYKLKLTRLEAQLAQLRGAK
jgi:chromosome segregation ATPase